MNIYDYLFTYAELDENNDFHIKEKGGGFNLFPGTDFNVSAAVSESENEKSSDDNWYFSRDVQYGEKIYCSAMKCVFNLFSIKNSAAGGVSFGECMKTGRFVRYQPSLKTDQLSFYLLMSYSDRFYREPVSGYPSVRLKRGGKAEYELNKNIGIEAAYNIDTYHEDYLTEIENRSAERIFFKIIYDADSYYFFTEFQRKNEIDEDDAEFITEDIIGFTAGARGDNISCLINPEIKYCNKEAVSRNIILESGVKHGIKTLTLRVKRETGEQVKSVISAKLGFKDTHYLIYSRGEYEKVDENGVKLKSVFRFASGIRITW